MSKIKNKSITKSHIQGRKKHVETMFTTNKQKNYPYYHKPSNLRCIREFSPVRTSPQRNLFYLRSLESGYLDVGPLKAIMRLYKWFIKNYRIDSTIKYRLFLFPDFVLTSKPKEVRMGKGKGAPSKKVAIVKRNQLIFYVNCGHLKSRKYLILSLLRKLSYKLPFKTIITTNS